MIKHLQAHYGTALAEFVRRALDAAHTKSGHLPLAELVPVSTEQPTLINMYLPSLLLDNSEYQARRLQVTFPEYLRRAVVEYAVPTIRCMYPAAPAAAQEVEAA
jgi:hypothetical protein